MQQIHIASVNPLSPVLIVTLFWERHSVESKLAYMHNFKWLVIHAAGPRCEHI